MTPRQIPKQLGDKLRKIREHKGWTLDEIAEAVGRTGTSRRTRVYEWEHGTRQPDLNALLAYARLVDVPVETLIDDESELQIEE